MSGGTLRETLGLVGVVASLIFVGAEVRQNTIASRAAAYQDIGFAVMEGWRSMALDRGWAELNTLANDPSRWDEIDDAGWLQLKWRTIGGMRGWETVYLQVQQGLLPQDAMQRFGYDVDPRVYFPNFERTWSEIRNMMDEEFAAYMEREFGLAAGGR